MNCQDFDAILLELVRGEASRSAMEEGEDHAVVCARCAGLLSDQRRLSASLLALAANGEQVRAPQRIESALRAEFRRRHARVVSSGVRARQRTSIRLPLGIFSNQWAWTVAAIVIVVAGVVIAHRLMVRPAVTPLAPAEGMIQPVEQPLPLAAVANPEPLGGHPTDQNTMRRKGLGPHTLALARPTPVQPQGSRHELTTNFYPLIYGSGLELDQGWQMVRVHMPASALASLGVPVTGGSPAAYIKADVVLGGDGMARAIRFVR